MISLNDIRYVRLGTPDVAAASEFATKIVGLQAAGKYARDAYFRSDIGADRGSTRDHTLVYFDGDLGDHAVGFDLRPGATLEGVGAALQGAGFRVAAGTAEECERRRVKAFVWFRDPSGNRIEIVDRPFHSGTRGFQSRDAGISHFSHIGLRTTDAKRDERFWTGVMNGRVSDWIGDAALLRINTVHHTLALFPSTTPGVQHINHQVADIDDVMRAYYFLREKGVRIVFGPGRHPTSSACFLYYEGPGGLVYEYSVGVKHIQPEDEPHYKPRQFPFSPESFCMWGSRPDIPEFRT